MIADRLDSLVETAIYSLNVLLRCLGLTEGGGLQSVFRVGYAL